MSSFKVIIRVRGDPHLVYQDIESLIKLKNLLSNDSADYHFTDAPIAEAIKSLHLSKNMNLAIFDAVKATQDDVDLIFHKMQLERQQQVIKSSLALEIISLCETLNKESPF
ncbi:MltR family transcriptional regulator [Psychromonas sp. KJ10-2]|uniref:MltR family transcriptional regulator n=1 Tax=Psychromonas sp. KJ10-2 TaxID=3391822 RepID=UPI0039B4D98D